MKKLGLYTMALLSMGLVGCNQDFDTEFVPQTNPQESLLQMSDVSVAANSAATINLADYINEEEGTDKLIPIGTVSVKEGAMPANTILKAEVEFSRDADFANSVVLDASSLDGTNEISVLASTLQNAYFNEITRNPATTDLYIRTVLYTVTGGNADAMIGKPEENFFASRTVKFTPLNKVQISPAYYLIGGPNDWQQSAINRTLKFNHSNKDVYEDPVFTIVFDANQNGDTWFAFGDDAACDGIANGDWSKLFGVVGGNSEATEGRFDYRYNLGADNSFKVAAGAMKIKVTIDMMDFTFTVKALNFAEYLWEAGVNNDWGAKAQPLYCADGNGKYVGCFYAQDADWSGGKGAFKFQKDFNDWSESYGFGSGDDSEGTLGGDNFMVEPGFYQAEINLAENSYKLTKITTIGIVGPAQAGGWGDDTDMTYNMETGAWEATLDLAADELKFRANDGWDINWGGTVDDLTPGGPNLKIAEAGKYFVQLFPICETKSYCKITKK